MELRVLFIVDATHTTLIGTVRADDAMVTIEGFGVEARGWREKGIVFFGEQRPSVVTVADGPLFLQAMAWNYAASSRVRLEPVGFSLMSRKELAAALAR